MSCLYIDQHDQQCALFLLVAFMTNCPTTGTYMSGALVLWNFVHYLVHSNVRINIITCPKIVLMTKKKWKRELFSFGEVSWWLVNQRSCSVSQNLTGHQFVLLWKNCFVFSSKNDLFAHAFACTKWYQNFSFDWPMVISDTYEIKPHMEVGVRYSLEEGIFANNFNIELCFATVSDIVRT